MSTAGGRAKGGRANGTVSPGAKEFVVDRREDGMRLDLFLASAFEGLSRKQAKRLIDRHRASVDGRIEAMASRRVAPGQRVRISVPAPSRAQARLPLSTLYEDGHCIAVAKPAGIPSGPTRDASRLHAASAAEAQLGFPLALLHRLDKETSGVLLLAKKPEFAAALTQAFKSRRVRKVYLAIVLGKPPETFEAVSHVAEGEGGKMRVVRAGGVRAETSFRRLASKGGYSLVEARPKTGRTHQIRLQLAQAGHPVVGDSLYGGDAAVWVRGAQRAVPRQMLHARSLSFEHPALDRELRVDAPPPEDFQSIATMLFGKLPLG
jgi:23S rRNA pseudouridine1911/1915/1917 synthase